jgi:hypothetical protein
MQEGWGVVIGNDPFILIAADGGKIVNVLSLAGSQHISGCIDHPKIGLQNEPLRAKRKPGGNFDANQVQAETAIAKAST